MIRHIASPQPPTSGQTLSLFADVGDLVPFVNTEPDREADRPSDRPSDRRGDRHLVAARRLAKAIRRLPDHSIEQTRTGQAICRHLIALLDETTEGPQDH